MFESKTCKVEESEFKIDSGEISIVVKIHLVDKGQFKYSGSKCKLIKKSHVLDGSELKHSPLVCVSILLPGVGVSLPRAYHIVRPMQAPSYCNTLVLIGDGILPRAY